MCDECKVIMSTDPGSVIRTVEASYIKAWSASSVIQYAAKFKRVNARTLCEHLGYEREKVLATLWRSAKRKKVCTPSGRTFMVLNHGNGEYTVKEIAELRET